MAYVRQHPDYPKFRMKKGVMPDFSGSNVSDQEAPTGLMNGVNKVFTTAFKPLKGSESLHKDGMMMSRASTVAVIDGDYHIDYTTGTITFSDNQIPQDKSVIRISYKYMKSS
jgi:hypothetical protein